MARRNQAGEYAYTRTGLVRGREDQGRVAIVQIGRDHTRVLTRNPDGSAPGDGETVRTADVYDIRPTRIVVTGQRGTITLPGEMRRASGIQDGQRLELMQEADGRIAIKPLAMPSSGPVANLDELLTLVTPDNLHGEMETGSAVGRESW